MSLNNNLISLLNSNYSVCIEDNSIKKAGFWKGLKFALNPRAKKEQVNQIVAFSEEKLDSGVEDKEGSFCLAEAVIKRYAKCKYSSGIIKTFEHFVKSKQRELNPEKTLRVRIFNTHQIRKTLVCG